VLRELKAWLSRLDTLALGAAVLFMLLAPTAVGIAVDLATARGPWGFVLGALLGVIMSTVIVASTVLGQYERLAPVEPEEDDGL
jgi:F0F1-type ATP synthase assembly protein I